MAIKNSQPHKPKVIYILPALGVGGVETALGRSYSQISAVIDLQIVTMDAGVKNLQGIPEIELDWTYFLHILIRERNAVIITSLWRAHLAGILLKCFGLSWIAFFHNPAQGHVINKLICFISSRLSDYCFFDSEQTKRGFFSASKNNCGSIIPFYFPTNSERDMHLQSAMRDIDLIYIGRFVPLKRLDLFVQLSKLCIGLNHTFKVAIAGGGTTEAVVIAFQQQYPDNVEYFGVVENAVARQLMRRSKFIACLSDYEGMAMTVVEGIQEGCVPVVRLVGEIGRYVDSESGIICPGDLDLQSVASSILGDCMDYEALRSKNTRAHEKLRKYESYGDAFIAGVVGFVERTFEKNRSGNY